MPESQSSVPTNGLFIVEAAVRNRYSQAAQDCETSLCCAVNYAPEYLAAIPREIIERDYGCGDPVQHVRPGEVVLDLGSGGGKVCYIAAQVVGPHGRVIGIDFNEDMLALARKYQEDVGRRLGYRNVEFRKGKIQDLRLDLDLLNEHLARHPVQTSDDWLRLQEHIHLLRETRPLVVSDSVDTVVSNCVLNLVRPEDRHSLFRELHRVLKRGGRAVISDIVSDADVPAHLQNDPRLWSGCVSGAFREDRLLEAFRQAGFDVIEILDRQAQPWTVVEGIEFRSITVQARKGKAAGLGPLLASRPTQL